MTASRRIQTDPYLSPCKYLKSKWINDCNIKSDENTEPHIKKKVGNNFESISQKKKKNKEEKVEEAEEEDTTKIGCSS